VNFFCKIFRRGHPGINKNQLDFGSDVDPGDFEIVLGTLLSII